VIGGVHGFRTRQLLADNQASPPRQLLPLNMCGLSRGSLVGLYMSAIVVVRPVVTIVWWSYSYFYFHPIIGGEPGTQTQQARIVQGSSEYSARPPNWWTPILPCTGPLQHFGCDGENRTHGTWLMRPCWNHSSSQLLAEAERVELPRQLMSSPGSNRISTPTLRTSNGVQCITCYLHCQHCRLFRNPAGP